MPWPVRWMNCSPYPASVITARAARSISWQATPGRTASTPACWAARTISCTSRISSRRLADADGAAGVGAVAVHQAAEVEHHAVADLDHPVAGLVVRVGAVRARADDGEVDLLVPEAGAAGRRGRAATSVSLRPANRTFRISPYVASAAAPAASSRASSSASLTARSIGSASVSEWYADRGNAACRPSRCIAQALSETPYVPVGAQQRRSPRRTGRCRRPSRRQRRWPARPRPPRRRVARGSGTSSVGSRVGGQDQHGEPLGDRGRLVAGQPDQVRARA